MKVGDWVHVEKMVGSSNRDAYVDRVGVIINVDDDGDRFNYHVDFAGLEDMWFDWDELNLIEK